MHQERFFSHWLWLGGIGLLVLAGLYRFNINPNLYQIAQAGPAELPVSTGPLTGMAAGQITADLGRDKLEASGFSPNETATFTLYNREGGTVLFGPYTVPTDGSGFAEVGSGLPGDVTGGQFLQVVDDATGQEKGMTLADLAITAIDPTDYLIEGTAPPETDLTLNGYNAANGFDSLFLASDSAGAWTADFGGSSILPLIRFTLFLENDAGDTTAYSATIQAADARIEASLSHDLLTGINFSPEGEVAVELLSGVGGETLFGPTVYKSDGSGRFTVSRQDLGIDLVPGQQVVMRDGPTGRTKQLTLALISIDSFDPQTDVATGRSDSGGTIFVDGIGPSGNTERTLFVGDQGIWTVDFQALGQSDVERVFAIRLDGDNDGSTAFYSPTFPTSTPIPSPTPLPSATPTSTPGPTATATPTPTMTPAPTQQKHIALPYISYFNAQPTPIPTNCLGQEQESNNTSAGANQYGPVCFDQTVTGELTAENGLSAIDIYLVALSQTANLRAEITILEPLGDIYSFTLYDIDGNQLSHAGGTDLTKVLEIESLSAGNYYLQIAFEFQRSGQAVPYQFSVTRP